MQSVIITGRYFSLASVSLPLEVEPVLAIARDFAGKRHPTVFRKHAVNESVSTVLSVLERFMLGQEFQTLCKTCGLLAGLPRSRDNSRRPCIDVQRRGETTFWLR